MNNVDKSIQENAKVDWMKLVNKHRKHQKGLPALSKLNTNAGNVEHNINMFNMMQPDGSVTVDASNGNVSSGDSACCESVESKDEMITLHYDNIPVEVVVRKGRPGGYYDPGMGQWYPDDDETKEILIDWEYEVDKDTLIEFFAEKGEIFDILEIDYDAGDEEITKVIEENFNSLLERYEDELKEYYYEEAISDAQEKYEYEEDYPEYEPYDESLNKSFNGEDDYFNMSMRTLL